MATKSKAPSLKPIKRENFKFVAEWTIPSDKYEDGQQLKWEALDQVANAIKSGSPSIGKNDTKYSVKLSASDFYPNKKSNGKYKQKLVAVNVSVRGNIDKNKNDDKGWSAWATEQFRMSPPNRPTVKAELTGETACKFTWTVKDADKNSKLPFDHVVIEKALIKDCTHSGKEVPASEWASHSISSSEASKATNNFTITESSATLATGNYTRFVRIKAVGCAGDSDWNYAKHVYAYSNQANQQQGEVKDNSAGGYDVDVVWDTEYDKSNKPDESIVEWTITTPNADMSCPAGASWTAAATIKDTTSGEGKHITIDSQVGLDQCLYTRVNTKHDSNTTYGAAVLQKVGDLKAPTGLSVENVSQEQQTAKITATNASSVSGAVIEVIYSKNGSEAIVGLITGSPNYITVKCPPWTNDDDVKFAVRAVLPKSSTSKTEGGVTIYTIAEYMKSAIVWQSGTVAKAPGNLSLSKADDDVRAAWSNNWDDANLIELSWSDNPNAWESTDAPDTFTIDNPFATSWRIAGLETGKTWYARVRSILDTGEGKVYSPYSEPAQINLSESPSTPTLDLSRDIIATGQPITVSWEYISGDGTPQAEARIYEYTEAVVNNQTVGTYTEIGHSSTEEYIELPGWDTSGTKLICVEVVSESGQLSGKSVLKPVTVAPAVSCTVSTSLEDVTVEDDDEEERTFRALTALPLVVAVTGAGLGGTTSVVVERVDTYHAPRPDEAETGGYAGETIYDVSQSGDDTVIIDLEDLNGTLDDGATYRLTSIVTDNVGQIAQVSEEFIVDWETKATTPKGEYMISDEDYIAIITPKTPTGAQESDTCDIYRLSADKPVLVFKGAEYGESYVDPYPTIGETGGYRLVCVTEDGCYTTDDNVQAFLDLQSDCLQINETIVDFDGGRVTLSLNMDISSNWSKSFTEKEFLGGSVKGFWQKAIKRGAEVSALAIPATDTNLLQAMRRLAEHPGRCHIRTPEGSSFAADVQVSENWDGSNAGRIVKFTLKIKRVENTMDGVPLSVWTEA